MILTIPLKPDKDGYTTQHCKKDGCEKKFKVAFSQIADPIAHCPYCGWHGQFWTNEQMKYLDCMAEHKYTVPQPPCTEPSENGGPSNKHEIHCPDGHSEWIKHDGSKKRFICIICGLPEETKKNRPAKKKQKVKR